MPLFRREETEKIPADSVLVELKESVEKTDLPAHARSVAEKELAKLKTTDPAVAEYSIGINYIQYILSLPWNHSTRDDLDLTRAQQILDFEHHGLAHVKERILEHLAVCTWLSRRRVNILVVDDEPIARDNLRHILEKEDFGVSTASNGKEALDIVKKSGFDIILTDLKMEVMDGIQLTEAVKMASPNSDVVIITGFATIDTAVDAIKKGATHYLSKPVKVEELRTTIRKILEKKRRLNFSRGPVLCFAGPPGTGKTSIGKGIASALGRKFIRISLAGLRDEADLRGHRRTYAGALPGRILNEIKRAGVKNPVFMLDEIDKIGKDFKGDPASVLLEILDPEQNSKFTDHFLDIPFDLSEIMFIATANIIDEMPSPLRDRLEFITFRGYSEHEKRLIAMDHLVPRNLEQSGMSGCGIRFTEDAVTKIIREYTNEAGLRELDRQISTVCRKIARLHLTDDISSRYFVIDADKTEALLGAPKMRREMIGSEDRIGVVTGLVWSETGGEIIFVEATLMKGESKLILTGSLGNVLQESAQIALSYIRSHARSLNLDEEFFKGHDIHIHIPSGAIPKDGPSAGITIAMALISLLTRRAARCDTALSGEITLSGRILPVDGVKEKMLAAQRAGVRQVILPEENISDINELKSDITEGIKTIFIKNLAQAMDRVLVPQQ